MAYSVVLELTQVCMNYKSQTLRRVNLCYRADSTDIQEENLPAHNFLCFLCELSRCFFVGIETIGMKG